MKKLCCAKARQPPCLYCCRWGCMMCTKARWADHRWRTGAQCYYDRNGRGELSLCGPFLLHLWFSVTQSVKQWDFDITVCHKGSASWIRCFCTNFAAILLLLHCFIAICIYNDSCKKKKSCDKASRTVWIVMLSVQNVQRSTWKSSTHCRRQPTLQWSTDTGSPVSQGSWMSWNQFCIAGISLYTLFGWVLAEYHYRFASLRRFEIQIIIKCRYGRYVSWISTRSLSRVLYIVMWRKEALPLLNAVISKSHRFTDQPCRRRGGYSYSPGEQRES